MTDRPDLAAPTMPASPRTAAIVPAAQSYYDRTTLADAIEDAWTRIEEWDYERDKHGYCHDRPVLLRLAEAAQQAAPLDVPEDNGHAALLLAGAMQEAGYKYDVGAARTILDYLAAPQEGWNTERGWGIARLSPAQPAEGER